MKILIVYDTKYGTTKECVEKLQNKLQEVTVINLREKKLADLDDFSTVVIGGPLYMGKLIRSVENFSSDNLEKLLNKKIGLFFCGIGELEEVEKYFIKSMPQELIRKAAVIKHFGGQAKMEHMNFLTRFAMKEMLRKGYRSRIEEENIDEFAKAIQKQ